MWWGFKIKVKVQLFIQETCVSEFPELPGGLDYKLCPLTPQLVGCVYEGDVWILDAATGNKHRMTFACECLSLSVYYLSILSQYTISVYYLSILSQYTIYTL